MKKDFSFLSVKNKNYLIFIFFGQIKTETIYKNKNYLIFIFFGQLRYKVNYKNNKKNGIFKYYYKNGVLNTIVIIKIIKRKDH